MPKPLAQDEYEEQIKREYPGWPGPVGTRNTMPSAQPRPVSTPLAPEGVESPLANWARRLIIGPRSIVEQTLREEAQTRQDAARSREAMALEGRRETRARENLLFNIREQARVNAEAEARKQAEAQAARTRLMRGVIAAQPAPEGEPEMRPRREEIIQEPGGAEMYKALREKPEQVKGVPPEHDIIGPRGEIIRPGKPKPTKAWYEGLTLPEMAMMEANLQARVGTATPAERAQLAELQAGMKTYERVAGTLAERRGAGGEIGRTREEEAARAKLPLHRGYKDPVLVNRLTLANESVKAPTVGVADAMVLGGTHKLLQENQTQSYRAGRSALSLADDIGTIGGKIFTGKTNAGVIIKGLWTGARSFADLGLGKEYNNLKQQEGRVMDLVRLLQGEARISDADLEIIKKFVSIESLFQSSEGFGERVALVKRVLREGLRRLVEDITVSPDAGVTIEDLKVIKPVDSKGRPIPAPTNERRVKVAP